MNDKFGRESVLLTPKQFLKAFRPERFSDSVTSDEPILDRSQLEYHLESLTSRNQEVPFAIFAHHLAEKVLCPNLLPQTGPVGGGDSKVDSETYPVAEDLAVGWYIGVNSGAASERWAFAFSAAKQWKPKAISDITKALQTDRGYSKVFFISNQFIPDKARSETEDKLRKQFGADIRLLDRTWILDEVFKRRLEKLAIEDLQISVSRRSNVRKGPQDTGRETKLEQIEARIQKALQEKEVGFKLVEDCIEAAILVRELERPRTEIDGLFDRAENTASKYGTQQQRLTCAYQRAWTAFWCYEDFIRFEQLYKTVEDLAMGSRNSYDIERLYTLCSLLGTAIRQKQLDERSSQLAERTQRMANELDRLCGLEDQPSAALEGRAFKLNMELVSNMVEGKPLDSTLNGLEEVVRSCEGLAGFPLDPLIELVTEIGNRLTGSAPYDNLFETIVEVRSARKEDVAAAQLLLTRGEQEMDANRPYDAIRHLGASLKRLYKHESRHEAVKALYLCGCAYHSVGLLWAARGTLLSAASLATSEYWKYGDITRMQAACYRRLKWLELELGRIAQALAWHEAERATRSVLNADAEKEEQWKERDHDFDMTLGLLLLKTDFQKLKRLARLPDTLADLGLPAAYTSLLYALGHEEDIRTAFPPEASTSQDLHDFFRRLRTQPAGDELPEKPAFYDERKVTLKSILLGCDISVESDNESPCVELSESVLAALESLLSTGILDGMISREPSLTMTVRKSEFAKVPFEFEMKEIVGRPHVEIRCAGAQTPQGSMQAQNDFKKVLFELLTTIMGHIAMASNLVESAKKLFNEEQALDRAIHFTGSFSTISNVLGPHPKCELSAWDSRENQEFPIKRTRPWDADDSYAPPTQGATLAPLTPGRGDPPEHLMNKNNIRQSDIQTISLIREHLWSKACWMGTAFLTSDALPPALALHFSDEASAISIFQGWRSELGEVDTQEKLRVSIIRGVHRQSPFMYRVQIGSNLLPTQGKKQGYAALLSRINTMTPPSSQNLDRFLASYGVFKRFYLMPAVTRAGETVPRFLNQVRLEKSQLIVKQAWEIGLNELECAAVQDDDDPVIPSGQSSIPVLELLQRKKRQREGR